jgi:ADP-heptose:LPS heptosyltransferase
VPPPHILILQLKRIGDAILTAPALARLRMALPEAKLTLVLSGASAQLGPAFGMVDERISYRTSGWNGAAWKMLARSKPQLVLDYSGTDRSAMLALLSRGACRIAYEKFVTNWLRRRAFPHRCAASVRDLHTIDFHHALAADGLKLLGADVPPSAAAPEDAGHLTLPEDVRLPALPARFAVVHPGSAREEKHWPAARWAEIVRHLHGQHGIPVILTGSSDPLEQAHLAEIRRECQDLPPENDLSGKLALLELAAVLSRAEIVLGVDSAAMHLAAAWSRPQVALFGPTNPYHWAPRHPQAKVLLAGRTGENAPLTPRHERRPMVDLPVEAVAAAADSLLR